MIFLKSHRKFPRMNIILVFAWIIKRTLCLETLIHLEMKIIRKSNYINVTLYFRQDHIDFAFADV